MADEVLGFLKRFRFADCTGEVTATFTQGCCYWFAKILSERFSASIIMYDQVENHFGTRIGDAVYDITGDVTDKYDWVDWDSLDDPLLVQRIVRDCIDF